MCSTSEDVQYESGISSVQARMCMCMISKYMISASEDVYYESGKIISTSEVCSTNKVNHHVLVQGEALLLRDVFQ